MAVRFCPSCIQNVLTKTLSPKCSHCSTTTKPIDDKLPIPEDKTLGYTYGRHRRNG